MAVNIQFEKTVEDRDYVYSDIHLDITKNTPKGNGRLFFSRNSNDIKADLDERAIVNSIRNLLVTSPRERILVPNFGINLRRFLFEPADQYTAQLIGKFITEGIEQYEPRVVVQRVHVEVFPDDQEYKVYIVLQIPALSSQNFVLNGFLNQSGFNL